MHDTSIATRREVLAFAPLATALIFGGKAVEAPPAKAGAAARPSAEELARAMRLYGGELGGLKGAR